MNNLEERIKEAELTKIETRIANFILDNRESACLKTATDLALEIGVSDSSVIRLTRTLGYRGFTDFQKQMKQEMEAQFKKALLPSQKYKKTASALEREDLSAQVLEKIMGTLQRSFEKLDMGELDRVCNVLSSAQHKYVFGFRGSAGLASFFANRLKYLLPNVSAYLRADSEVFERAVDFTDRDCIVVFSFPVYTSAAISLVEIAEEKRAKIIVITDKVTSPLAAKADLVITADVDGLGFSNSYVSPMAIIDLLLVMLSKQVGEKGGDRLETLDKYIKLHDMY